MCNQGLTEAQIIDLAIPLVHMVDEILAYFQDPMNERAFQAWCIEKYGKQSLEGDMA